MVRKEITLFFVIFIMLFLFLSLFSIKSYAAEQRSGHLKLLAVSQTDDSNLTGSVADLYLTITPGQGNVYIQTYPLLKVDTQISTRFGKDIACNYLEIDCSNYDFFYTIKALSPIVGGPSAGSAITALTTLLLMDEKIDEKISMTGTINSGGIVGPVGGVIEKIEAASKNNIKKVLVPVSELEVEKDNTTIDVVEYGKKLGVKVVGVSSLEDIIYEMTGKKSEQNDTIIISGTYEETMKSLADKLCARAKDFSDEMTSYSFYLNESEFSLLNSSLNLRKQGEESYLKKNYYSAASFCYGANVRLSELKIRIENPSKTEMQSIIESLKTKISELNKLIEDKPSETVTDLEAYLIVKERLDDASSLVDAAEEKIEKGEKPYYELSYAKERFESANYWSEFFGKPGNKYLISKETLAESCSQKIEEAEERSQYIELFFSNATADIKKDIKKAYEQKANGQYKSCLFSASLAKAHSDVILSAMWVSEKQVSTMIEQKQKVARMVIAKQAAKGNFPIMGYSYYEYANSLKDTDPYSSMIYSEYAIELSNLDMYFPKKNHSYKEINIKSSDFDFLLPIALFFVSGLIIGFITSEIFHIINKKKQKKKK